MKTKKSYKNFQIFIFGILSVVFILAFVVFTFIPYLQERLYLKKRIAQEFESISVSHFIFYPYTHAQAIIRYDLLSYILENPINDERGMILAVAIEKMEEVAKREDQNPRYAIIVGRGYDRKAEITNNVRWRIEAESWYQRALASAPNRQDVLYLYGQHLLEFPDGINEAVILLRKTLALDERVPLSHYYLGLALVGQGISSYAEALKHIEFFLKVNEDPKLSPDAGMLKGVYLKFLTYFYNIHDKENFLKTISRLAAINSPQQSVYKQIKEYIEEKNDFPLINLQ